MVKDIAFTRDNLAVSYGPVQNGTNDIDADSDIVPSILDDQAPPIGGSPSSEALSR